jgi:ATP-dependent DNA helicase PIF1
MLFRNIDPARGLCNGTRLIVVHIGQYLLRVRLAHKPNAPIEAIPRFTLSSLEGNMPFMLTRKQFPVKLCFSMTINKSQGQSLKYVGVDLRLPPFMHGQLYVALSRATSLSGVSVHLPENTNITNNVVYSELLLN